MDKLIKYKRALELGYNPAMVDKLIMRNGEKLINGRIMNMKEIVEFFELSSQISDIWLDWAVENE